MTRISCALLIVAGTGLAIPAMAGSYQGPGAYSGTPSSAVTALFAAYPTGGDALVAAVREMLAGNPDLAHDVAFVATAASPSQQAAAGAGMAQAFVVLNNRGDTRGSANISSAAHLSANPVLQVAITAVRATDVDSDTLLRVNPLVVTRCRPPVSPSRPDGCR